MRFWDTSALVPVLIQEPATTAARRSLAEDASVVTWWGTSVECTSAISRAARSGRLASEALAPTLEALGAWRDEWIEVDATSSVRLTAERLVRTHPIRAADALQLAAAIAAAEGSPTTLPFVTGDGRLADAAVLEGFPVIRLGAT